METMDERGIAYLKRLIISNASGKGTYRVG